MQAITSCPEMKRSSPAPAVEVEPAPHRLSPADLALIIAIVAPLAVMGLLVVVGFGIGAAVCIMFILVFAVTTTMDARWLLRRRRSTNDLWKSQS